MSLEQRLAPKLEQRLTLEQKLKVDAKILGLRLRLIGKMHGEKYTPHAVCPKCSRRLTPLQIIKGFKRDENDYTTKYPRCQHRFEPRITVRHLVGFREIPFFCSTQTLGQLRGKEDLSPVEFRKNYPPVYQSAVVHFGGLPQAFQEIGIKYRFKEPIVKWEKKVKQFLGLLPDTVISRLIRVKYSEVRKLRLSLHIPRYRTENLL